MTQKLEGPLPCEQAGTIVKSFIDSASWKKLDHDASTVEMAAADSASLPNPFWDLLIAETMKRGRVKKIITENVRDFEGIPWVKAADPFRD